jgi:hypothetical protein
VDEAPGFWDLNNEALWENLKGLIFLNGIFLNCRHISLNMCMAHKKDTQKIGLKPQQIKVQQKNVKRQIKQVATLHSIFVNFYLRNVYKQNIFIINKANLLYYNFLNKEITYFLFSNKGN